MLIKFQRMDITLNRFDVEYGFGDPSKFRNVVYVDVYEDNIKAGEMKLADKETLRLDGVVNISLGSILKALIFRKPVTVKEHKKIV